MASSSSTRYTMPASPAHEKGLSWKTIGLIFLLLHYTVAVFWLGYQTQREDFSQLIILYSACFALAAGVYFLVNNLKQLQWVLIAAVVIRAISLFAFPNLSDDFYRFLWDGYISAGGGNPFELLPSQNAAMLSQHPELFDKLNSQDFYTIYPPLNQFVFWLSCQLFPNSYLGAVSVMKLSLLLCEAGTIYLMYRLLPLFRVPVKYILFYAINPLVVIELVGNLHFEAASIFFMLAGVFFLVKERTILPGVLWGFAICAKLLPILLVPFIFKKLGLRQSINFGIAVAVTVLLLFLPFWSPDLLHNFGQSVKLYVKHFEFNASFYYAIKWLGYKTGIQQIAWEAGTICSVLVLGSLALLWWRWKELTWPAFMIIAMWVFTIYQLGAAVIHPWYLATIIFFSAFSRWRFPLLWSLLIIPTYITYHSAAYQQNFAIVWVEYILVIGLMAYELYLWRKAKMEVRLAE